MGEMELCDLVDALGDTLGDTTRDYDVVEQIKFAASPSLHRRPLR